MNKEKVRRTEIEQEVVNFNSSQIIYLFQNVHKYSLIPVSDMSKTHLVINYINH